MARSDAGAVPSPSRRKSVELVRQSVRSAATRHGIAEPPVQVDPDTGDPLVQVDRRRFERVMTNLIDNAHRYAQRRGRGAPLP